jgi:hypothetical protein
MEVKCARYPSRMVQFLSAHFGQMAVKCARYPLQMVEVQPPHCGVVGSFEVCW